MEGLEKYSKEELIELIAEKDKHIARLEYVYNELLRKSEGYLEGYSHYLETLGRLPVGIFLTDHQGNYVYVNQTWCDLTGLSYDDAKLSGWLKSIVPEQQKQVAETWKLAFRKKQPFSAQYELSRPDGSKIWISTTASWITFDNNAFPGYLGAVTDINAEIRTRSEIETVYARLKTILSSLQSGILVEDEFRRIVFTNEIFTRMFSIPAPPEELIGIDCSNSAEESKHLLRDPESFIARINELLAEKKTAIDDVLHFKDGRIFERDYIPVYINDSYRGHLWQYRDVTDRMNAARQLEEYAAELKASNEGKDRFLSVLSHDLKNSFTSIFGFTEFLYDDVDKYSKDDIRSFAKMISDASRNVYNLLSNLLEWGKIQFGKMQYTPKAFDLYIVFEEILAIFKVIAGQKQITIHAEVPRNLIIKTDRQMLFSVIQNVINNAVKFSHKGTTVLLRAFSSGEKILIQVEDHGVGMPDEISSHLFNPDNIRNTTGTNDERGTGLGLLIVSEFVQKMSGEIRIHSVVNEGTTVTIELPTERL